MKIILVDFLGIIVVRLLVHRNQVQIEKAQHLLLFTDQSLEEVAESVGMEIESISPKCLSQS
ncbi:MAG: transcriptional regulator GlxA family with amidase domain [Arcticibacterium sp.]|jgi:transcriptional regulator GlxA family with amidase domain